MKKLVVVIGLCLSLSMLLALPAAAETSLSFGVGVGDAEASDMGDVFDESDLQAAFLGLDYTGERFGAGFFWLQGNLDDGFNGSDTLYFRDVYGSWHFIKSDRFQLDLVLSYDWFKAGVFEARGFMLGLTGVGELSDRCSLTVGMGYAINPKVTESDYPYYEDTMSKAFLKLDYAINDEWSANIGYITYQCGGDSRGRMADFKEKNDLILLGFTYHFGNTKPVAEPEPQTEPVVEAPKEEPKPVEEPKAEEPKVEEVKPVEEPKVEEPVEEPQPEPVAEPTPITEAPKPNETPEEKEQRIERINEFLHPIFFNFDKYYIRKDQIPVLKEALKVLQANKDLYILIAGHADPPGSNAYNQKLSERRALAVRNWLVANGISASRITMIGYGEEYPYMAQSNDPKWESDRWADIVMTDQAPTKEMGIRK